MNNWKSDLKLSSKWDILRHWASYLFPFILITSVGIWNESMSTVAWAGIAFISMLGWGIPAQMKRTDHLKSAIQKLKDQAATNEAFAANASPLQREKE